MVNFPSRICQKIDCLSWKLWRSIFFVVIVFLLVNFLHDLNGQSDHYNKKVFLPNSGKFFPWICEFVSSCR